MKRYSEFPDMLQQPNKRQRPGVYHQPYNQPGESEYQRNPFDLLSTGYQNQVEVSAGTVGSGGDQDSRQIMMNRTSIPGQQIAQHHGGMTDQSRQYLRSPQQPAYAHNQFQSETSQNHHQLVPNQSYLQSDSTLNRFRSDPNQIPPYDQECSRFQNQGYHPSEPYRQQSVRNPQSNISQVNRSGQPNFNQSYQQQRNPPETFPHHQRANSGITTVNSQSFLPERSHPAQFPPSHPNQELHDTIHQVSGTYGGTPSYAAGGAIQPYSVTTVPGPRGTGEATATARPPNNLGYRPGGSGDHIAHPPRPPPPQRPLTPILDNKEGGAAKKGSGRTVGATGSAVEPVGKRVITTRISGVRHWSAQFPEILFEIFVCLSSLESQGIRSTLRLKDSEGSSLEAEMYNLSSATALLSSHYYRVVGKMTNGKFTVFKITKVPYIESSKFDTLAKKCEITLSKLFLQRNES